MLDGSKYVLLYPGPELSEAARIELRGKGTLNSKSETNRGKVQRLKIDLEGWKKEKLKESSNQLEACQKMEASLEEMEMSKERPERRNLMSRGEHRE